MNVQMAARTNRRIVVIVALVAASTVLAWLLVNEASSFTYEQVGNTDFLEYWAAARLLSTGANPYDPNAVMALEYAVGWTHGLPVLMWNPPPTLVLTLPLALLPLGAAAVAWRCAGIGAILTSGLLLGRWRSGRAAWWHAAVALAFVPCIFALRMGQISPWLLLGVSGFLWASSVRRDVLAGVMLSFLLIKPHVVYLFLAAVAWWLVANRRWRIAAALGITVAVSLAITMSFRPSILQDYSAAYSAPPYRYWRPSTLGSCLRQAFGAQHEWLQYAPSVVGIAGLGWWLVQSRGRLHWTRHGAPLLLGSVISAAYGWSYDQTVLLPVVLAVLSAARDLRPSRRCVLVSTLLVTQLGLLWTNHLQIGDEHTWWHAPMLGAAWWLTRRG